MSEENEEGKHDLGWMISIGLVIIIVIIGVSIYNVMSEPYRVADELRGRLKDIEVGKSEDYKQGWNDCVKYYINEIYGPKNATAMLLKPYTLE